jgi:putative Holliday junction resolvase
MAEVIVIGEALGGDGEQTRQSRHARKIADVITGMSPMVVILWDESESTRIAREIAFLSGANRKKRSGHMDDRAAAVILQSYLDNLTLQELS